MDVQLDFVRTKLPPHVADPDPGVYKSDNYVVFDTETTTHNKGLALYDENSLVLACWHNGPDHPRPGKFHHFGGEYDQRQLVTDVQAADFVVCHNGKFDLAWLERCGVAMENVVLFDTMLAEYVLGGNQWVWHNLSLNACAERRGWEAKDPVVSAMIKSGIDCTEIPESWLLHYCDKDVDLTWRLFEDQRYFKLNHDLLAITYTRCLLTPVLVDIEKNGMHLDSEAVHAHLKQLEAEYAEVLLTLEDITDGINVNSTPQLVEFLYDTLGFDEVRDYKGNVVRTPSGGRKADAGTIDRLKPKTGRQRDFLREFQRMRAIHNELTKYLRKFGECCDEAGGQLRAQFNQSTTQTHRLSSSGLDYSTQFQNFPRQYKPLFRARTPGWYVGEVDGSQLEFRVAAHLGRDPVATGDIASGVDIHTVTASVIWPGEDGGGANVPHPKRTDAKAHTFKPLYGGQSGTPDEVRYYEFFREKYSGITATQRAWISEVLDTGRLVTEWGLIYYWPDTRMERSGYITNSRNICNYPVQALATAEIIPIGLVYFWHYAKAAGLTMRVVNSVHDSVIVELPPGELEVFDALAYRCMVEEVYRYLSNVYEVDLTVPLAAGVCHGERWGDKMAKDNERQYTADDNLWR